MDQFHVTVINLSTFHDILLVHRGPHLHVGAERTKNPPFIITTSVDINLCGIRGSLEPAI
jgi:hypothetical protein